jgi:hypothetical protein
MPTILRARPRRSATQAGDVRLLPSPDSSTWTAPAGSSLSYRTASSSKPTVREVSQPFEHDSGTHPVRRSNHRIGGPTADRIRQDEARSRRPSSASGGSRHRCRGRHSGWSTAFPLAVIPTEGGFTPGWPATGSGGREVGESQSVSARIRYDDSRRSQGISAGGWVGVTPGW